MKDSKFTGGVVGCFGYGFLMGLIITISLGIATPWAVCMYAKFVANNTTIDGKKVEFKGTGSSLFGNYIIWFLLVIVTLGIYSFWVTPKMISWVVERIHIVE